MKARLHADGGARGNPGPAGIGAVLLDESGRVLAEISEGIGWATNNIAEYKALIAGLEAALSKGVTDIDVFMDSDLVVSQMSGRWKIRSEHIRPLAMQASALLRRFDSASIAHVARDDNSDADRLANRAMDEAEEEAPGGGEQGSFLG